MIPFWQSNFNMSVAADHSAQYQVQHAFTVRH